MNEVDIKKRLGKNDALFRSIGIITQQFEIIPDNKNHIGAYIEYQDIRELREEFLNELSDSIVDWVYSSEKFTALKEAIIKNGKPESAATMEIGRKAKMKFRGNHDSEKILVQGQLGELLLFHFIQKCFSAVPILRKMNITTSSKHERYGADAIHYKIEDSKNIIILGEAKTYYSKYKFREAFSDAIESILNTYENHRKELNLYVHEDFLDPKMNEIAEQYLNCTLENVEVHLVTIVTYDETQKIKYDNENEIKKQIRDIIEKRYREYDNNKIDIVANQILKRITYIIFPVWNLEKLVMDFQNMI